MNIAILTQPICNNYGGILQNYALQTMLERMGHTVTTLNYPVVPGKYDNRIHLFLSMCHRFLWKMSGEPGITWLNPEKQGRKEVELSQRQKEFIGRYLHLIDIKGPITKEQIKVFNFDAFIIGSDQVWRPRYNKFIENMFLDFTDGMNVKRIAYAASFGTDKWEMDGEQTKACASLAKKFDAISVRESSGVELCEKYLGVDAVHVLDPTLLLDAEDYLALCSGDEHPEGDYIAVYVLDCSKERMKLLKNVSKQFNLPLHFIGRFSKAGYPSIESWLVGIANAKYVITDSFHGTVFSIIFQKQFITLGNAARGNERLISLLRGLDIDNRITIDINRIIHLFSVVIDYSIVKKEKKACKDVSMCFLIKYLCC